MKKFILSILCCLMSIATWAVKADPTPVNIIQPDGSNLTIVLNGDEDVNWYSTVDGVYLVQKDMAYYVAQVNADGSLTATSMLAHNEGFRSDAEKELIAAQNKDTFTQNATQQKKKNMARRLNLNLTKSISDNSLTSLSPATNKYYFPHSGSPKVLVILVQFADTTFKVSDPQACFNEYLNGTAPFENKGSFEHRNHGSVREYFTSMSNGQFTPLFDVVGPVTVSNKTAYYGGTSADGSGERATQLVIEACKLVDDQVDFSQYDSDGDGKVDLVYLIYAGWAQSHANVASTNLWPKSFADNCGTYDGKSVYRCGISNELNFAPGQYKTSRIEGIGLFCHEFTHTMGLPDFYSTFKAGRIDNQAMERWDLMDEGEYIDNGYCPAPYSPWEKEVMGWTTIETLSGAQRVELQPGEARKIVKEGESQYLTLYNLQLKGWDSKMPYHGLLITRIDYQKTEVNSNDYPNNTPGSPGMTIVPADGALLTSYKMYGYDAEGNPVGKSEYCCYSPEEYWNSLFGDPFPGSTNVTQLLSVKLNNNKVIDDQPLYKITEDAYDPETDTGTGVITFNFIDENIPTAISAVKEATTTAGDDRIYDLFGRVVSNPQHGIYIKNGKKFVVK